MTGRVELARQQWQEAYRTLTGAAGAAVDETVREQIEAVRDELRRRLGGPFTLAELAHLYDESSRWTVEAIAGRCARPGWYRSASAAADAAFHLFSQGARDYRP